MGNNIFFFMVVFHWHVSFPGCDDIVAIRKIGLISSDLSGNCDPSIGYWYQEIVHGSCVGWDGYCVIGCWVFG